MKPSLWLKLVAAFVAVVLLGSGINAWLVSRATQAQFSRYVSASGQAWARNLTPTLAAYYVQKGTWNGVDTILQNPWSSSGGMGNMMGNGMMGGMMGNGSQAISMNDVWGMMGLRLLLADEGGKVVVDTLNQSTGLQLAEGDLAVGEPVHNGNVRIGTLLVVSIEPSAVSPGGEFLRQINQSTWLSGLIAALAALAVGSFLFRQIVSPVQHLTAAAQKVASGDLTQHIEVHSQDELGQLSVAFNQMAAALARDQELRRNLMADVAHELRTPLSVIQGNLEAMLDGVLPTSPAEIASLRDETALLARLVSDMRMLSLAEAGQLKLERVYTDLPELIRQVLASLRPQAEADGVTLTEDLPETTPLISLDPDRISQVLYNLLTNALRYTSADGTVTVRLHLDEKFARVEISDTGSGIAPADLPYLFDRFYRADKSRSRSSGGSGIGLAIVRQLVRAHDGEAFAESPILRRTDGSGYGSRFTFTLPIEN